jgi:hypothetical protein
MIVLGRFFKIKALAEKILIRDFGDRGDRYGLEEAGLR